MTNIIIGVDPGKVCGIAWYELGPTPSFGTAVFTPWNLCCDCVFAELKRGQHAVLAIERYTLGGGRAVRTAQPEALMTIGALTWAAHDMRNVRLLTQGAADAARVGQRDVLERLGWWTKADRDQHCNKAAAQVALAMLTVFPDQWERLTCGSI